MPYAILLSPFVPGGYSLPEDLEMFFVGHNSEWIFQCRVTALWKQNITSCKFKTVSCEILRKPVMMPSGDRYFDMIQMPYQSPRSGLSNLVAAVI